MKIFKRLVLITLCAAVVACSFSGCSNIFGSLGNSGGCNHSTGTRQCDETSHYLVCVECGGKFDIEKHTTYLERRDNDNEYHYISCAWCNYILEKQPHTFSEWRGGTSQSNRSCTVCNFRDVCGHEDVTYVITDEKHGAICNNCEFYPARAEEKHVYDQYTSVTETTHTLCCKCGKVSGDAVPHELLYRYKNDEHWLGCECGYEKEKEACTFGDYIISETGHYKSCLTCSNRTAAFGHSFTLTNLRERVCDECEYKQPPYYLLVGTWKYDVGHERHLILSSNWSYVIEERSGKLVSSGDYFISDYECDRNGDITGSIKLSKDSFISFKFKSGETEYFTSGYKTYTKI